MSASWAGIPERGTAQGRGRTCFYRLWVQITFPSPCRHHVAACGGTVPVSIGDIDAHVTLNGAEIGHVAINAPVMGASEAMRLRSPSGARAYHSPSAFNSSVRMAVMLIWQLADAMVRIEPPP
jgi:hypothetical protein